METQGPEFHPGQNMQVKRRINQFFGNILRKDKTQLEDQEEASSHMKNKQKNKNNQSYSQWDLMENIAGEPIDDESTGRKKVHEENMIYSDGLAYYTEETLEELSEAHTQLAMVEHTGKKNGSFLKRSGSLLRKSLRRSKKKSKNERDVEPKWEGIDPESLTDVVQEINSTLFEVAKFGEDESSQASSNAIEKQWAANNSKVPLESDAFSIVNCGNANEIFVESSLPTREDYIDEIEWNQEEKKVGLKNGLKRQASKIASKFQRTPRSMRLKSTVSVESFPNTNRNRSASICTNTMVSPNNHVVKEDIADSAHKRTGSFKRKLSFKQAKKAMKSGATSFGKSMMHFSAVMPISYESPPVTFYPDYEDEYPPHMVQCYYRTLSYQPKDCAKSNENDKAGHYARPTSFYQHGYCYNG